MTAEPSPDPVSAWRFARWARAASSLPERYPAIVAAVLLVSVQGAASWGLWNAGVSLGDDACNMLKSYSVSWNPRTWASLFLDFYAIVRWATGDQFVAHLVMRFILAQASVLVLFQVLRSLELSWTAQLLGCIFWIGCSLTNPIIQDGNVSIFSFCIAGWGLSILLQGQTLPKALICALLWFLASLARPEYFMPLMWLCIVIAWRVLARLSQRGRWLGIVATVGGLGACLAIANPRKLDAYLLLGLKQCFAEYYVEHHPGFRMEPFTEYKPLIDRVFGYPKTFTDALAYNPIELARYIASNTVHNLSRLVPYLLNPRRGCPINILSLEGLALFAPLVTILGVGSFLLVRREGTCWGSRQRWVPLIIFASASSVAIVLLLPNARYWIALVPIVYAWAGCCAERVARAMPKSARAIFFIGIGAAAMRPVPWHAGANRHVVDLLRQEVVGVATPVVGALFPHPWAAMVSGSGARVIYLLTEKLDEELAILEPRGPDGRPYLLPDEGVDSCLRRICDIVIITPEVRKSHAWLEHRSAFALLTEPAGGFVLRIVEGETEIYVRKRKESPSSGSGEP